MKFIAKLAGWFLGVMAVVYAVGFIVQGADLMWFKFWGPKIQSAEREVFEETKSFRHGQIRDLANFQREYRQADNEAAKQAIKATVRHRFAELSVDDVPEYLRDFLTNMRED